MAQARVTTAPHHDLSALATLLGDRGDPALCAQHLIIPFGQGLGGFGKQPGGDLATDPREGLHNRHIGWPPVSSGASAKVCSNASACWAQLRSCSASTRRQGSKNAPWACAASAAPGATGRADACKHVNTSVALTRRRRCALSTLCLCS